jgi:DNA-binding transcriptional regulator YbjK
LQPSLFTRLQAVEAELQAMKDLLGELTVNQNALRLDRDEWRWRAERLLKDRELGLFWRWRRRADAALDIISATSCKLMVDLRAKLATAELHQRAAAWLGRAEQLAAGRLRMAGRFAWLGRIRKAAPPAYRRSSS